MDYLVNISALTVHYRCLRLCAIYISTFYLLTTVCWVTRRTSVINRPAVVKHKGSVGDLVQVQYVVTAVKGLVKEKVKQQQ